MAHGAYQGSLFTNDFVEGSITELPDWEALPAAELEALRASLNVIFSAFPTDQTPNEATTEHDLIWPILAALGWRDFLTQQNLTTTGRTDVPDAILFSSQDAKTRANACPEEWRRYEFGAAVLESKRWLRPLDRRSEQRDEITAPSTQMLRYLRRVDDLTSGNLRWGILTNGLRWRLYYSGAQSIAEDFFEIDLGAVLGLPGLDHGLFALDEEQRRHWLRVFVLVFRRQAFERGADQLTFHQRALAEGKYYEERVAKDLSDLVFGVVFPALAEGIANADPEADLQEVREAALILLYRLLFILYAEDRGLLPVRDRRYDDYSLRDKVRLDVRARKDRNDTFSATAARYWGVLDDLFRAIDEGDSSIGLPPYNGGLFSRERTPLLARIRLGDALMANVIDYLSYRLVEGQRRYINYRDLSVQQLGSIYERLLEYEVVREEAEVRIRPNVFARKGSGSYYTPDDLVGLILGETLQPLISRHTDAFRARSEELARQGAGSNRRGSLTRLDPAQKLLELKICDPAMGSGHFLVSLVDKLADNVLEAMAEAEAVVDWADYNSPLADRIEAIRNTILDNAEGGGWTVSEDQLDDRHIIRRMVLKRCVYGVDKNPMAVELAKVALWLHTFTVGAPLSFLDHHLRAGDSLFGEWVRSGIEKVTRYGSPLVLHEPIRKALLSASKMQIVEGLTDAEIAEAHRSQDIFEQITDETAPLNALLSFIHALEWIDIRDRERKRLVQNFFDGQFGDPVDVLLGKVRLTGRRDKVAMQALLDEAQTLIAEERYLHWQIAFPGVWTDWEDEGLHGGFDAVIGNPPWDRMKLQQVEWFAVRRQDIALAQRASDRTRMIADLETAADPLFADFTKASERAETAVRLARTCGDYPLLSSGDINIYSLFVERAMTLVKPDGMVGLLTPSGIASDKTASVFFKEVATAGRLIALYDFENRKTFFPDVHASFKFCIIVATRLPGNRAARCGFYFHSVEEISDPERCFELTASDFAQVNPQTGTAPVFRYRRDADLTKRAYGQVPILLSQQAGGWPVKFMTMFHMANDSGCFRTKAELEEAGAYLVGKNHFRKGAENWVPLYQGRMIEAYDHRYAGVGFNPENIRRGYVSIQTSDEEHRDVSFEPTFQYFVSASDLPPEMPRYFIAYRRSTATTNARTMVSALAPHAAYGDSVFLLAPTGDMRRYWPQIASCLQGAMMSLPLDFIARNKLQGQNFSWYILQQLPVPSFDTLASRTFGKSTAMDIVLESVLELTYTSHSMSSFAVDLCYVNEDGTVKPPFVWDDDRRLHLRAKLDAVYFHLYGVTDRDDVRYIYSTFPIVEREETETWGSYRSRELCLHYMNALAAGDPDAVVQG